MLSNLIQIFFDVERFLSKLQYFCFKNIFLSFTGMIVIPMIDNQTNFINIHYIAFS